MRFFIYVRTQKQIGFVYKKDGGTAYILTNNHVIEGGDAIYAEFNDGNVVETKVKGRDSYSDTAVLAISSEHKTSSILWLSVGKLAKLCANCKFSSMVKLLIKCGR